MLYWLHANSRCPARPAKAEETLGEQPLARRSEFALPLPQLDDGLESSCPENNSPSHGHDKIETNRIYRNGIITHSSHAMAADPIAVFATEHGKRVYILHRELFALTKRTSVAARFSHHAETTSVLLI